MGLNIKNDETCQLAGELARLTGETMTGAITVGVARTPGARETRAQRRGPGSRTACHRRALCQAVGSGPSAVEHGDVLYDERGLPK